MCKVLQEYLDKPDAPTQEELAERLGIRQATISRWASGLVSRGWIKRVSKATGIPRMLLLLDVLEG